MMYLVRTQTNSNLLKMAVITNPLFLPQLMIKMEEEDHLMERMVIDLLQRRIDHYHHLMIYTVFLQNALNVWAMIMYDNIALIFILIPLFYHLLC